MAALLYIRMVLLLVSLMPRAAQPALAPPTKPTDLAALFAFKAQVKDPLGILDSNWSTSASPCSWVGVSCDRRGHHVTGLEFDGVPLQGSIAPQLGNLSFLSSLVLSNTSLVGPVPRELGGLPRLQNLVLSYNSLSGTIPSTLGNLTSLESLYLDSNNLFGSMPSELGNLNNLQSLRLSNNDLSGLIPPGLFNNTPNLRLVRLGSNRLTGAIPDSIGSLSKLEMLVLERNLLSGPMPPAIFNMSQLQTIAITRNNLSGPIPSNESFYLPMLEFISLGENQFDGPIPHGLSACKNLHMLSLPVNNFTGPVPSWLAMMPNLTRIYLSTNGLTGKIPMELSNNTGLLGLDLSQNKLEGGVPPEYGQLRNLSYLSFANNRITGSIPESIGYLSNLTVIDFVGNDLTGSVPISFGNLLNLRRIWLSGNQLSGDLDFLSALSKCRSLKTIAMTNNAFTGRLPAYIGNLSTVLETFIADNNGITGSIPSTLANLTNLLVLSLSGNKLSGRIPTPITAMSNLQELNLANNSLSGTIPTEINGLKSLSSLHLDNNRLVGSIPSSVSNLSQIQIMTLSYNLLSSTIPTGLWHHQKLMELDLSENSFSGSLPVDIGKLTAISKMDLSNNQLSGDIPASFGELQMMIYLNLSSNLLEGSVPDSVGKLLSIEELDFSSNALSGAIPKSLANLTYLTNLNLSFNRLDGKIPEGGVFSNITLKSLMGNRALCGLPREGIARCQNNMHSTSKQLLLKVILPAVVTLFILSACLCMLVRKKMNKHEKMPLPTDTDLVNYQLISYHELVRATSNFSDDNLLGAGGFGKVFRGQLDDESVIAIKVLNMQDEVASKSFDTECRALRMARHRNLVRIVSTCSNLEFKALVLEYMPNGSLDDWLHSNGGRHISFLQQLGIMLDVAMAMEYLHHQHFEVVLHFDLKPSNILLDMDMIAHVADFGISKLLAGDDNSIVLTSMPGTVGYMAPEFGSTGKASRRSDVYSFGIVVLEIFTRKKPTDPMFVGELSLRQWVSEAFPHELSTVTDSAILQNEPKYGTDMKSNPSDAPSTILNTCLVSIIELGLLCSRTAPDERMPMDDVVVRLNKIKTNYCSQLAN
ncbi:putative receptor-like protein kinase At3g47110 [Brachypodium distachyon]|uniref:non-specific serine/threonine protein kinase n=1 Tax=Brachypodium distachyon TaxID=15368 RepID=A0A0Q3R7K6_BRADI|nr:putative receptor-like protein kinase At3g47110 [Brachypodium distachyon]KQK09298.1 hypothetical protein BRADI_2g47254v3 [Brachypodium distachyon]|eukprot:XP_014755364.1 putative receptor-like protein kinase At3g47110 [Brachypodium distachyon]